MLTSKLSSKGQVTIPKEVREKAGLHPGDVVLYEVNDKGNVTLRRFRPLDKAHYALLDETLGKLGWDSPEDHEAFDDL
jgi:AbrB family looped-hinge helix DNA binding protein